MGTSFTSTAGGGADLPSHPYHQSTIAAATASTPAPIVTKGAALVAVAAPTCGTLVVAGGGVGVRAGILPGAPAMGTVDVDTCGWLLPATPMTASLSQA